MSGEEKNWNLLNGLALAYIGDAVFEVFIRQYLLEQGQTRPNELHRNATLFVSAKAQSRLIKKLLEEKRLSETEEDIFKRGRNAKSHTTAKNADVATYRASTGFEALMGYLHMTGHTERLEELVQWCIQDVENERNKRQSMQENH